MEGMGGVKGMKDFVNGMEQDTSSDTAPMCITLNQVSHQLRHQCNSREEHEAGDWGRQPRARELAFVTQREEKDTPRGTPRPP
jgi:hypothetical protein